MFSTDCQSEYDNFEQPLRGYRFHKILEIFFLRDTFIRSQYYGLQGLLMLEVKSKDIENI